MSRIALQVDTDGGVEVVEVDLDFESLTMRESVWLEEALGTETFDGVTAGKVPLMRPSIMQAMLYVKLRSVRPGITIDSFDIDLTALQEALTDVVEGEGDLPKGVASG